MGKAKKKRDRGQSNVQAASRSDAKSGADASRRKFLVLGLGGLGTAAVAGLAGYRAGWFGSSSTGTTTGPAASSTPSLASGKPLPPLTLAADRAGAIRAADEIITHYSRELNNPSVLIHGVRAMGRNFTLNDGSRAVDFLSSRFTAVKEVNGKRLVYYQREAEVHDNSFLKTFLEAGVSRDQPITAGGNQYTLADLGESAKALFRCDPKDLSKYDPTLLHEHLPWGLIAFSILTPAGNPSWVNAYGETIDLPAIINSGLAAYEGSCSGVGEAIARGEMESLQFRQEMAKYACSGLHAIYGFFSVLRHGFRQNELPSRLQKMFDTLVYRLEGDPKAIDRETEAARQLGGDYVARMGMGSDGVSKTKGATPADIIEVMGLRHQVKALGHALEAINYVRLHKLFSITPEQSRRIEAGEQSLYSYLVKIRALDLDRYFNWHEKFVSDLVIALAHASRAMKLLSPSNPDTVAINRTSPHRSRV